MLDKLMKASEGSGDSDLDTKRGVLQEIIDMCKQALGGKAGSLDADLGSKLGGSTMGSATGMLPGGDAEVLSDKPGAKGSKEEEDDEKEYLKSFGGEE